MVYVATGDVALSNATPYERRMRRVYSEHVPWSELDSSLLRTLAKAGVELAVAVPPVALGDVRELVARCAAAHLPLVLWPLLDDADGRWPSAHNVAAFDAHVGHLTSSLTPGTLLLDLEPPIAWTRDAVRWRYAPRPGKRARPNSLVATTQRLRESGWVVEAVVPPMLAYGSRWGRWFGTPVEELACQRVESMAYTSLFEGYSRGMVDRDVARDLLARIARLQPRAIALGVVGGGALGDERAYRDVGELREDVGIASALGVEQLSLYALDGMLLRGDVETWLQAFTQTEPSRQLPRATRRGALLVRIARALGGR